MEKPAVGFVFTVEMGAKLREFRLRAGLSQGEVMRRVGRMGKGAANLASRLESGSNPSPSLGLVAEYLRSCGADFAEFAEVLDIHTHRELPAVELIRAACEKKGRPRSLSKKARMRIEQALKVKRNFTLAQVANRELERLFLAAGAHLTENELRALGNLGRRVFFARARYSGTERRDCRARVRIAWDARDSAKEVLGEKHPLIEPVEQAMRRLCEQLQERGKLAELVKRDREERLAKRSHAQARYDARLDAERKVRRLWEELRVYRGHQASEARMAAFRALGVEGLGPERRRKAEGVVEAIAALPFAGLAEDALKARVEELAAGWDYADAVRRAVRDAFVERDKWQRSVDEASGRCRAAEAEANLFRRPKA